MISAASENRLASSSMAAGELYFKAILKAEATVDQKNTANNP